MRQQIQLETLLIAKGAKQSNAVGIHGDAAVLTIYAPVLKSPAIAEVSPDGDKFFPLYYKGAVISIQSAGACNIPVPACKLFRISVSEPHMMAKEFQVLEMLEI